MYACKCRAHSVQALIVSLRNESAGFQNIIIQNKLEIKPTLDCRPCHVSLKNQRKRAAGWGEMANDGKETGVARERMRKKTNDLNVWSPVSLYTTLFICGHHGNQGSRPSHFKSRFNSLDIVIRNYF